MVLTFQGTCLSLWETVGEKKSEVGESWEKSPGVLWGSGTPCYRQGINSTGSQ